MRFKVAVSLEAILKATISVDAANQEAAIQKVMDDPDLLEGIDFDIDDIDPDSLLVTHVNGVAVSDEDDGADDQDDDQDDQDDDQDADESEGE